MEEQLMQMFPEGQWGLGQKQWMVRDGTYFCAAADVTSGEIVLTELGHRLLGTVPKEEKPAGPVEEVVIPEFAAMKAVPKKTGLRK